ncbi:SAM-dependent methyltransferase [Actinoplanes sp. NPDC026670]|uniref:SAM-dependent methyltransferase n=1 Tax=Actinoplanes sp. NPDC026670 TaxID=3154700 RepID=UPI0033FF402F
MLDDKVPNTARVYNCWLGGKDNFAADRVLAQRVIDAAPDMRWMVHAGRQWMLRVVDFLAREGIRQFLDLGVGLPHAPNLHEQVQQIAPESRIVHVDNDPLVIAHARALLISDPSGYCGVVDADIRAIDEVLTSREVATIDLAEPVGIVCSSVLMLLTDRDDPWGIVGRLREWAPPGSYLAISHPTADHDSAAAAVEAITGDAGIIFTPRTYDQVRALFGDWQVVSPGVVPTAAWCPDRPTDSSPAGYDWAGVARNPDCRTSQASAGERR